jgi:hypothetical protein
MALKPAVKDIERLIAGQFDIANTSVDTADALEIHTGQWSITRSKPTVAVYGGDEGPIDGGQTGFTAYTGGGGRMQVRGGTVTVGCVAGRRTDLEANPDVSTTSPKKLRYELAAEVNRVVMNYDVTGYESISPGDFTRLTVTDDNADTEPSFYIELPVDYTYKNDP